MPRGISQERLDMLRGLHVFSACSDRELNQINRLVDEVDVREGEVLMRQGDPGRQSFIVIEGEADVTVDGTCVATLGPGTFIGEMSLIDLLPRVATVTARTPMRLLAIGVQQFSALLNHRNVAEKLLQTIAGRLREVEETYVR